MKNRHLKMFAKEFEAINSLSLISMTTTFHCFVDLRWKAFGNLAIKTGFDLLESVIILMLRSNRVKQLELSS